MEDQKWKVRPIINNKSNKTNRRNQLRNNIYYTADDDNNSNGHNNVEDGINNGDQTKWYWTKWYGQNGMDKMVRTKWPGQNGSNFYRFQFN